MSWQYDTTINPEYGVFSLKVWRGNEAPLDVTFFRDKPVVIENLTYADPFGDATAMLRFPQITGFDSISSVPWLREFTNVDVHYYPCTSTQWHADEQMVINPMTQKRDLYLHQLDESGAIIKPIWEGFMVSLEPGLDGVSVQCQGALYQLDYYYAKPLNPARPRSVEGAIKRYFNPAYRGIYTKPLFVDFPADWERTYTMQEMADAMELGEERYLPTDLNASQQWTGYLTRYTGSWEKILTGYVQGQLSYMYASPDPETGIIGGNLQRGDQWTITKDPGRIPRMYVRRKDQTPTVECWYGQPGVDARLTRDGTQVVNVFFADGKGANAGGDVAWNMWSQPYGPWCIWKPIAAKRADETPAHQSGLSEFYDAPNGYGLYHFFDIGEGYPEGDIVGTVWPVKDASAPADIARLPDGYDAAYEKHFGIWVSEKQVTFPDGIEEGTAREIAYNWLAQDEDPGWSGTIEIKADLRDPNGNIVSKWSLRAGDVIVLKGFQGRMTADTIAPYVNRFHISQVQMNPMEGTVQLTVDTKFRDLLTVEEAIAKGRDTLSPVKSLQVNRRSALINDMIIPWNVRQGSGYFPRMAHTYALRDSFPHSFPTGEGLYDNGKGGLQQLGRRPRDIFKSAYLPAAIGGSADGHVIGIEAARDGHLLNPGRGANYEGQVLRAFNAVNTNQRAEALYVPVNAGSTNPKRRWALYPIMLSQAGTIMRSEFAVYDYNGDIAQVEFHVSIYPRDEVTLDMMPFHGEADNGALEQYAFESYNPETGYKFNQNADNERTMPTEEPIVGWGNYDQPAGYSPKTKIPTIPGGTGGNVPTGLLVDGAPWTYDFYGTKNFPLVDPGEQTKAVGYTNISVTCVVYIAYQSDPDYDWLYVRGRVYRGNET